METVIIIMLYFFLAIFDFFPLKKKGKKKEIWIYLIAVIPTFIILFLGSFHIIIPGPTTLIKEIVKIFR